jgi:integrase
MAKPILPLNDTQIKNAKPKEKDYKLFDGKGLFLLVRTDGSKLWRCKYLFANSEKLASFGKYPEVSLLKARQKLQELRTLVSDGIDPIQEKREQKKILSKVAVENVNTFGNVFKQYLELQKLKLSAETYMRLENTFKKNILPVLENKPIESIAKSEYVEIIKTMADRGAVYYANRTKGMIQRLLYFAEEKEIIKSAPVIRIKYSIPKVPKQQQMAHITEPEILKDLLLAIDSYQGDISTQLALQLLPMVFVRPKNIRFMEWSEIDFKKGIWSIPAEKMKMKNAFQIPLPEQALAILKYCRRFNGSYQYVFVSPVSTIKPLSENTLNQGLQRIGFKGIMTSHGFRHTASTLLNGNKRHFGFELSDKNISEIIEVALAHTHENPMKSIYDGAEYIPERKIILQWWADYLTELRTKKF